MNKIFKVVWSKTKECYVVVSEVAKNNGGKKKVLASVLAGLAMAGVGAFGNPALASYDDSGSKINIAPNAKTGNYVGNNSVVVGYENRTDADNNNWGRIIYGANNIAAGASTLALGNENEARGDATTAIGVGSKALDKQSVALGNVARATKQGSVAIGSYVNAETKNSGTTTAPVYNSKDVGQYSTAVGSQSWTKGDYSAAYGYQAEATDTNAVAIGRVSKATGTSATAVGVNNKAQAQDSSAVGSSNTIAAGATQASAFGRENTVNRGGTIAAGYKNTTDGDRNVAIGNENTTTGEETIGIGTKVIAGTGKTIAIGSVYNPGGGVEKQTIARGDDTINPATRQVNNIFALAIGNGAQADGKDNKASGMIAIGQDVLANNNNTIAMGIQAKATGNQAIAFGKIANASGSGAFALGQATNATSHGSIAMGNGAQSTGSGSTALGRTAQATKDGSVAVGFNAEATGDHAIAIGGDGKGAAYDNTNTTFAGLNEKTTASAKNAVAIGHQATANIEGGVALGSESKTTKDAGEIGYNPATGRTNDYKNLTNNTKAALTSTRAAVSIGDDSASVTRQLTGLAAGTQDTDAVNVAQLKAVNLKYAGDSTQVTGSTDVRLNDGTFNVNGDGTLISTEATATGIKVTAKVGGNITNTDGKAVAPTTNGIATTDNVTQAINNSGWKANASANGGTLTGSATATKVVPGDTVTFSAGKNLTVAQTLGTNTQQYTYALSSTLKDIESIQNGTTKITLNNGGGTTISGGNLSVDGNKITNVAPGTDDTDAVNYKQLKSAKTVVEAGTNVTVNKTKGANGEDVYTVSSTATGGTASTESVVKKAAATGDTNIADVSVADNKNVKDPGAQYEVSVSKNAVKDAAREAVTVNNGGTTKADGSYTADTNNPITVNPVKDDTNHNTTYEVKFDGAKAAKVIPLTYKANGTGDKTVTLEKGLDFTNGTNTTAEIDNDGVVKYNLNKNVDLSNTGSLTVGGTKVNNGGVTITAPAGGTTTDVKLTNTGLDNGGNKITNVAEGTNNTDAVNVKQLKANRTEVKAGDNVVVTTDVDATDNHTVYTVNAVTPAVYTTPDGEKLTKDKDGKFHKVGETAEYTGDIITSFENPKAAAGQTTKDGGMIVNNVGSAIKNQTGATYLDKLKEAADANSNVKNAVVNVSDLKNTSDALIDKGLRFDANEGGEKTNKLGSKVTVQGAGALTAGKAYADEYNTANIRTNIEQGADGNTTINVGLAKALKDINSISNGNSSITISDVPAGATTPAVTISGGNLSMGDGTTNNKIVNLAPGTDGTDAVNLNQLKGMRTVVTSTDKSVTVTSNENTATGQVTYDLKVATTGTVSKSTWDLKSGVASATEGTHSGDTTQTIADTKSVTMQAGKNLTVKQTNDGNGNTSVAYSLDKDLTNLDKVVVNGKDGQAGKDGVTIVGPQGATGAPGIPGTNGIDGKVGISGKDGKDAVSIAGKDGVGTIGLTGPQGPAGTNGKSVDISTENGTKTLVKPEANNNDQSQRIVYVPKDANGNPLKDADNNDIKREVATMDDGLKFAGDDGQTNANKVIAKQLNQQVDIIGGATGTLTDNNIGVNNDGGKLKVQLAKDVDLTNAGSLTIGGTTVNNDGITIKAPTTPGTTTTDVKLTNTGLDNGGNTITNVAEGQNNTDAVNVKQLKENRTEVKAGDNVVVTSAVDATDNHTVYTVNAVTPAVYTTPDGEKLTKDKDGKFHKVGETAEYTGDIITSFENPKAAAGQTTKDGGMIVNNVGSAIKNQTPTMPAGQTATYLDKLKAAADAGSNVKNAAVNVSDLHNTAEALKASELHIAPTVGGKDVDKGGTTVTPSATATAAGAATQAYKYNATTKQVELTFNDGNGKAVTGPKAVIDLSDLANQITSGYTFSANATANGGTVVNDTATPAVATAVENGGTINYAAGKNLTVKQDIDAANKTHTYTYSLDKDLTNLDKVVVNGKDGVAGKDGVTIVGPQGATGATGIPGTNGIDGKVGITGKDGKDAVSIAGKDGVGTIGLTGPQGPAGTNGKSVDISTENGTKTLVKPEANNNDQSQRIVYVPKDANGNPLKDADNNDIKREVATMDDGLTFTGNNESTENKQKLGSLVKVQGEGTKEGADATGAKEIQTSDGTKFESAKDNIAVEADGANTLTVKLNKDLKGLDSVTTKEVKLGDANDNISIKKAGDRITYTTPGSTDTHKVATLDDEMHIKDTTYTVDANKKVTLTYVDGNSKDVAGKKAIIDLSGLPVGDKDTDMRIKEGTYTAQNGKVTLNTVDKDGNPVTGKDVVIDGINTNNYVAGDNVTLTPDTDAAGKPVVKINAALSTEKVVKKAGADNLATVSTVSGNVAGDKGETYEVAVTKGDIENNAEISYKANGGTAQKTTLAKGFNFTSDDSSVAITTGADGKVNFKVDTSNIQGKAFNLDVNKEGTGKVENAQTAAATPSVEKGTKFVAGNNLSIRHDGINGDANYDHQVTYALNSDLKGITSITNNGGATMNFGPNEVSITGGNLNMGGSKITNVKNGTDKSDVATVGQLTKVTSNDNTVAINKTTDADGAPVYDLSVQGGGHDPRIDQLGEEVGRVGAQGAALAALKPIQYDPLEPTQIMAGYGNYRGNSAIAMGVAHYKNESTMMHAGVSWAGGSRHMMANAGVTWKVGNRDSEAAVADRYRKGPISSAYAMQQEMASVKAQNAGLKTEVSDLKAENEQMKAQIAAMMAKLGM